MRRLLLVVLMMSFETSVPFAAPIHDAAKNGDVPAITAALNEGVDITPATASPHRSIMPSTEHISKQRNS